MSMVADGPRAAGRKGGTWLVRDFAFDDLEAAVALDAQSTTVGQSPVFKLADVVAALQARHPAVVAVAGGQLVGAAVGRVDGDRAWVIRISLSPVWRGQGLGSALLAALEHRLLAAGARRLCALLPDQETGSGAFTNSGFIARSAVNYYEKTESVSPHDVTVLAGLGGVVPPAGLWQQMAGMRQEKALIERRIVLPLSQPELADAHGVEPPRAVVLFGPPGTGKTTFARAIASRLGWPFVELFPSRLAAGEGGVASGLARMFDEVAQLDHVVVFMDEVEEIAGSRADADPAAIGVVNELLKAVVAFRDKSGRLLVCATNAVSALDAAFLRHGRFDYVLPIGPPDAEARQALWERYLAKAGNSGQGESAIDIGSLVHSSDGFTPADIAHAARTTAQQLFERTVDSGRRDPAITSDYLQVINTIRPTVTSEMAAAFREDIGDYARS